jgi:hypothetical protein
MDDDVRAQVVARLYSSYCRPLTRLARLLVRDEPTANQVVHSCFTSLYDGWYELAAEDRTLSHLKQEMVRRCRCVLRERGQPGGR